MFVHSVRGVFLGNKNKRLSFDTKSGTLTAIKAEDGKIMLNLPARMNKQVVSMSSENSSYDEQSPRARILLSRMRNQME